MPTGYVIFKAFIEQNTCISVGVSKVYSVIMYIMDFCIMKDGRVVFICLIFILKFLSSFYFPQFVDDRVLLSHRGTD